MGQGDEHSDQGTQTWQILSVTFNRATIKTQKKKKKLFKHLNTTKTTKLPQTVTTPTWSPDFQIFFQTRW